MPRWRRLPLSPGHAIDVVAVVLFVAIGRRSHDESNGVVGFLRVLVPFVLAVLLSWGVFVLATKGSRAGHTLTRGWLIWIGTVGAAMVFRRLDGRGTPLSFVIVTTLFLGLFMLGWRALLGRRLVDPAA